MSNTAIDRAKHKLQTGQVLTTNELALISNHFAQNPVDINNLTPEQVFHLNGQLEQWQQNVPNQDKTFLDHQALSVALTRCMAASGDSTLPGAYIVSQGNAWGTPTGYVLQNDTTFKDASIHGGTLEAFDSKKDIRREMSEDKANERDALLKEASQKMQPKPQPQPQLKPEPEPEPKHTPLRTRP